MMEFVYVLSNDRFLDEDLILERPLIRMLNKLSWKKEQIDKENAKRKQDSLKTNS
jgi:hypothetical protein